MTQTSAGNSLSDAYFQATVMKLVLAINSNSSEKLRALSDNLAKVLTESAANVSEDVRRSLRQRSTNAASSAFTIGQLALAQQIASYAASRQISEEFKNALRNPKLWPYVSALADQDLNGIELARQVEERVETVSRKLNELRRLGVTDFRREGVNVVNFLTPTAKSLVFELSDQRTHMRQMSEQVRSWVAETKDSLPRHLQKAPKFSIAHKRAKAEACT